MSLEKCPTCKKRISTEATSCPKCGHPLETGWAEVIRAKEKKRRRKYYVAWAIMLPMFAYLWWDGRDSSSRSIPNLAANVSAIDKMELAFQNNPPSKEIERRLTNVLKNHGEALTDENYSRVGSMLVVLRKKSGIAEMEILKCVEAAGVTPDTAITEIASLCVTTLD